MYPFGDLDLPAGVPPGLSTTKWMRLFSPAPTSLLANSESAIEINFTPTVGRSNQKTSPLWGRTKP